MSVGFRTVSDMFESGYIGMTDDLPEAPFIASSLGFAEVYHSTRCQAVKRADESKLQSVSESAIMFHEMRYCQYCSGEYDHPGGPTPEAVAHE